MHRLIALAAMLPPAAAAAQVSAPSIQIPQPEPGPLRDVTVSDIARLRDIDSLSVSPDGKRFAILVRQADPARNDYRTGWFVGDFTRQALNYVGDGGEARLLVGPSGGSTGDFGGSVARWSPSGNWIAYTRKVDGAVQLWRSPMDGGPQEQVSHNAGDVRDFIWDSDDRLLFSAEPSRIQLAAEREEAARRGFRLDSYDYLARAISGQPPDRPLSANPEIFAVDLALKTERAATAGERAAFDASRRLRFSAKPGGTESAPANHSGAVAPAVPRGDGAAVWMVKVDPNQSGQVPVVRFVASLSGRDEDKVTCLDPACTGQLFLKSWWSADGQEVLFQRLGGDALADIQFFAWNPSTASVRRIASLSDSTVRDCDLYGERFVCLREGKLEPRHVATIAVADGRLTRFANVNPEFSRLRLGKVERIEWETPPGSVALGYPPKARGFLLYPPGYNPKKRYPIFIAPYVADGFLRGDAGDEHPMLAYSAAGMIVLNTQFPMAWGTLAECGDFLCSSARAYDPKKGYPHLETLQASTFGGLDAAAKRASIDLRRVGIGGVSHGAFVPIYMLQKADRLTALSVAGGSWNIQEYYGGRLRAPYDPLVGKADQWPANPEFWAAIDIGEHLDTVEAPILFHLADREISSSARLLRQLSDARLPFEAYGFTDELHLKWQPAHRLAIYQRNLDWFRFWLMDEVDGAPEKAAQYADWQKLRALQCANPKSLRDYCRKP